MNDYAVTYKGRIVKVFKNYDSAKYFYEKFCDTLSAFELEYVDIVELDSDDNLTEAKTTKKQIQEGKTNRKYRIIWDDCDYPDYYGPIRFDDIENNIHIEDGNNIEDLYNTVRDIDHWNDHDDLPLVPSEQEMLDYIKDTCEEANVDFGDLSPNVLYLEIDGKVIIDVGSYDDSTEGVDFKTITEGELKNHMVHHMEAMDLSDVEDGDYGWYVADETVEDDEEDTTPKTFSEYRKQINLDPNIYNKAIDLAKKINKPVLYAYKNKEGKYVNCEPVEFTSGYFYEPEKFTEKDKEFMLKHKDIAIAKDNGFMSIAFIYPKDIPGYLINDEQSNESSLKEAQTPEAKNIENHKDYSEVDENGYTAEEVEAILKAAEGPFEDISFEDFCKL